MFLEDRSFSLHTKGVWLALSASAINVTGFGELRPKAEEMGLYPGGYTDHQGHGPWRCLTKQWALGERWWALGEHWY